MNVWKNVGVADVLALRLVHEWCDKVMVMIHLAIRTFGHFGICMVRESKGNLV